MFYIFFDVDGVLNRESDWKSRFSIRESCVKAFAGIAHAAEKAYGEVRLVIISTWRAGISRDGSNVSAQLKGLYAALQKEGLSVYGSTPVSDKGRQAEVEYYIRRNSVQNYLVIDDDPSLFTNPERLNMLVPDYKSGLTDKDVKIAKKMI